MGTKFRKWAKKVSETPAQAELRRRFEAAFAKELKRDIRRAGRKKK